jgi:hypothetical protein
MPYRRVSKPITPLTTGRQAVIALNAAHLERLLHDYVAKYCNPARPPMSLDGNAPIPRTREATPVNDVVATPVVGGLHHTYRRAA